MHGQMTLPFAVEDPRPRRWHSQTNGLLRSGIMRSCENAGGDGYEKLCAILNFFKLAILRDGVIVRRAGELAGRLCDRSRDRSFIARAACSEDGVKRRRQLGA